MNCSCVVFRFHSPFVLHSSFFAFAPKLGFTSLKLHDAARRNLATSPPHIPNSLEIQVVVNNSTSTISLVRFPSLLNLNLNLNSTNFHNTDFNHLVLLSIYTISLSTIRISTPSYSSSYSRQWAKS